jgi:hypothetical protein
MTIKGLSPTDIYHEKQFKPEMLQIAINLRGIELDELMHLCGDRRIPQYLSGELKPNREAVGRLMRKLQQLLDFFTCEGEGYDLRKFNIERLKMALALRGYGFEGDNFEYEWGVDVAPYLSGTTPTMYIVALLSHALDVPIAFFTAPGQIITEGIFVDFSRDYAGEYDDDK